MTVVELLFGAIAAVRLLILSTVKRQVLIVPGPSSSVVLPTFYAAGCVRQWEPAPRQGREQERGCQAEDEVSGSEGVEEG